MIHNATGGGIPIAKIPLVSELRIINIICEVCSEHYGVMIGQINAEREVIINWPVVHRDYCDEYTL